MGRENIVSKCLNNPTIVGIYNKELIENGYYVNIGNMTNYEKLMDRVASCPYFNMIKHMPQIHENAFLEFNPESNRYIILTSLLELFQNNSGASSRLEMYIEKRNTDIILFLRGDTNSLKALFPDYSYSRYKSNKRDYHSVHFVKLFAYLLKNDLRSILQEAVLPREAFKEETMSKTLIYPPEHNCIYFYDHRAKKEISEVFFIRDEDINNMRMVV